MTPPKVAIPPAVAIPPPPAPFSAATATTTVTDDPLAPFLLPVDSPRHTRKRGIARMVEQTPNWQKLALGAALLVALLVLGYALFFRDDVPDVAASPSVPAFTNTPATTPPPATVSPPTVSAPIAGLVDRNCSNFSTQQEAQNFYKESGGPEKDLHGLDPDKNGTACDDAANPIGATPAASPAASIPQPSATQTTTASP